MAVSCYANILKNIQFKNGLDLDRFAKIKDFFSPSTLTTVLFALGSSPFGNSLMLWLPLAV